MASSPQRYVLSSVKARRLLASFLRVYSSLCVLGILNTYAQGASLKYIGKQISYLRTVPEGSSVDFSCELSDPAVTVTLWQMLGTGGMYTPRRNLAKYGQVFTLHRVTKNMQGMYLCRVRRPLFSKNIGQIWVTSSPKDPPRPSVDQREKMIFVNRDANLTCKATGTRIASVQWYKWAKKLSIQQQVVTKELNLNGETWTNTLTLKNVTMDQAGWYECRVFETGQDYGFWSSHEKLKVLGKTECPELNGTFADPQRATGYLVCSNGKATRMNCSEGLVWGDEKKPCVKVMKWKSSDRLEAVTKTVGESVTIDCRLNDPSARVKLKQRISSGLFIERFTDRCRITREGQKFVIHAVNFNDFGIYFCEAPHVEIKRKQEAFLKIDPAPKSALQQGYRNLFVTFGSSLDLNCGAHKVFQPRMYLEIIRTDGITLLTPDGDKVTLTGRILTIHGLDSSMHGKVVCKVASSCARTREDVDLGFLFPVAQKGEPPIPAVFPELSVVNEGDNLVITCSVSVEKQIQNIAWYKDKKIVSGNMAATTASRSVLSLNNVTKSDAGNYECRVVDFGVGYWFKSATVKVEEFKPTPSVQISSTSAPPDPSTPPVMTIFPYQPVDISCSMFKADTKLALWQESTTGTFIQRIPDGVALVLQGNVFTITQGRHSDGGTYYCQALGSRKVPVVFLTFYGIPLPEKAVWIPNKSQTIDYMGAADIACIVHTSVPADWNVWSKTDQSGHFHNITNNKHNIASQTFGSFSELVLQVRNASKEDAGTYNCRAQFSGDIQEADVQVAVRDPTKGQVLLHSESQTVKESQSAELWCKAGGSPQPQVTWKRHGRDLGECSVKWGAVNCRSFSKRHVLAFSKGTYYLHVPSTTFSQDSGNYSCHVENLAGSENVTIQLTVQVKPSVKKNASEIRMIISASDSVYISCTILHSNPPPTLSWWNQTCLEDSSECKPSLHEWGRVITDNTSSLEQLLIPPSNRHALFKCTAENWLGFDDVTYIILRRPDMKPPNITNFVSKQFVNASATKRLICETDGQPPFADIQWLKNGAHLGSCRGELQHNKTCHLHGDRAKYKITWVGSGAELMVMNALHPFDSGDFTCVASNAAGKDTKIVTLDVHEKPVLNKKNDTDFRVLAFGAATTIQSTALRGHPRPYFKWFRQRIGFCASSCKPDDRKWRRVPRSVINPSAHVPSRISRLFLPPSKSGYYFRCVAENALGRDDVVYQVHRMDIQTVLPEIIPSSPDLPVDERDSFKLICQANAGDFQYLTWQKRDGTQMLESELKTNDHNLTNTLSVEHAQLEDAGEYLCVGWTNNDTKISVITVFVNELIAPVVSLSNKTIHKAQTNKTILHCAITSGYPAPNITWYKDGVKLNLLALGSEDDCRINGFHYMEKHRPPKAEYLVICKPNHVENTGLYKCEADNIAGNDSSEGFLNVLAQPKIVDMEDSLARDLGDKVNVTCGATGNPVPSVKWVKKTDKGSLASVTQLGEKNHTLRIDSVQEHHYGEYICVAENRFGNDTVVLAVVKRTPVGAVTNPQPSSKVTFIVAILVSVVLFLLLLIIAAILFRRRQLYGGFYICTTPPLPDLIARLDASIPLIEQVNKLPYDKRWEFPREQLEFGKVLGSGAFGEVYLAEADGSIITDSSLSVSARHRLSYVKDARRGSTLSAKSTIKVAVKTLKEGADEVEHKDLQSELKILIHIGSHKNIVNLLGACTKGPLFHLCVIIEYCPYGNMLQFLRKKREVYDPTWLPPTEDPDKQFTMTDVVSAAFQVARAMEFLASRKCVHRDLAARNVLIGENYVVKVADFGLARDVYKSDEYIKVSSGLVPVKWMAIESLTDRVYSEQSDVWSYGIFLWEMFTLGGSPYPGLPPTEIYQFIVAGNRMDQPVDCPDIMYFMMRDCWMETPADRPNFTALVQRLDHVIESNMDAMGREGYLDLGCDEPQVTKEAETDCDGYLNPVELIPPPHNKPELLLNGNLMGSNKELQGSNRSVASETKVKDLLKEERYTELGFKPSSSANSLSETVL